MFKKNIRIFIILFVMTLVSLPVVAITRVADEYQISRYNTAGTSSKVMQPVNTYFCYLSGVSFEELDTGNEEAYCMLSRRGLRWVLEARLDKSADADVDCWAMCYSHEHSHERSHEHIHHD